MVPENRWHRNHLTSKIETKLVTVFTMHLFLNNMLTNGNENGSYIIND